MGNSSEQLGRQIKFIQTIEDRHFGQIDIFRNEDGKFIMKVKRNFVIGDRRHIEFKKVVEWASNDKTNLVAPIISIKSTVQKSICIQYDIAEIFTEYYNYTLLNLIDNKKELDQTQLWFILQSLLQLTTILRKNKLGMTLDIDNVFITLKGALCVYTHHLISFEESIQCNQYGMGQLIAIIILQLAISQKISLQDYELSSKEVLVYISKICNKYKILGRLVKELLNRQKCEEEALKQIKLLAQTYKITKANQIKLNKFKYAIPQHIQNKDQPKMSTQQKNRPEMKIVQFKPNRKSNSNTIQKSRNRTNSSMENSLIPKQHVSTFSPLIMGDIKNRLNERMNKQINTQILTDIQNKKRENELKKQRFQMRKEGLISGIQNKENMVISNDPISVQHPKAINSNRVRRQTQGVYNSKRR